MRPSPVPSLADHLACRRTLYCSALITVPSVLVIDIPPASRGEGLALKRYYAIIIESEAEHAEIEAFLTTPGVAPQAPDILDRRPSNLWSETIMISRYEPPTMGWPWLSVTRWSDDFVHAAREQGQPMARGRYTIEMFDQEGALDAHHVELIGRLSVSRDISVRMLSADRLTALGAREDAS